MRSLKAEIEFAPAGHTPEEITLASRAVAKERDRFSRAILRSAKRFPTLRITEGTIFLVLEELFVNILFHDILDVHGADRNTMSSKKWGRKTQFFQQKIVAARGLKSKINVVLSTTHLTLTVTLARPFPTFQRRWNKQKIKLKPDYVPTEAELCKPCGRGLLIMANFFDHGSYDSTLHAISFTRAWKKADLVSPK